MITSEEAMIQTLKLQQEEINCLRESQKCRVCDHLRIFHHMNRYEEEPCEADNCKCEDYVYKTKEDV